MPDLIPRPDILSARRLLAVQPHPDDNEIGAGALIARLAETGAVVRYVTVTDGSMGTSDPDLAPGTLRDLRRQEADAAARLLGVPESVHLGYRDLLDAPHPDLRERLLEQLADFRPDFVLTCDPWLAYESHPDHRSVGLRVAEAVSFMGMPLVPGAPGPSVPQPMVAFYGTSRPNQEVPAENYWDLKWQAIGLHRTQFAEDFLPLMRMFFEAQAGAAGFVERFKILHPLYLHFNPGAETA